ncbi:hypothetical protein C0995_015159 [Termitomyces sp. Mi166|nr:hypothetical protein C0995_015159 [Termitomyces sp. Mi166\
MALTPNMSSTLLLLTIVVVLLPIETYAFGAGDIPDFSYLNDKAFRHGDIENILENLAKTAGGMAAGGGLLGFASSMLKQASGGDKFTKSDVKRVYFVSTGSTRLYSSMTTDRQLKGNWLRDYSQCMDIAGLSKLTADTLVLIVSVLGFVVGKLEHVQTFGFATEEFEVTADRLGVYLPVEHIDNPKGYAAKEGDARQFHPKLRPPVDGRELEIDERTGMKNYMATENQGWDTSTAFIRRTLHACIEAGRRAGGQPGAELYEAYRLLGTGLHTLEDLLAHSNWCEVALRKLGHEKVFCHVGDNVIINTPNGPAPPLVTGADFIYSLMGEATDKLSQASVTEITQKMNESGDSEGKFGQIKDILSKLPIGGGDDTVSQGEEMNAAAKAYHFDPDNIAPPEVQERLLQLLKWRDQVYRDVVAKIEMVPGLSDLLDELTNALNAYVYTILSPYIVPLLQQATGVLGEGSKAVVDSADQYEVFDNPDASDPSHSFLSKELQDHFDLILNEPAGKIAQLVVENTVNLIVQAWAQHNNPDKVIDQILEAFHHPYYADGRSEIQHKMFDFMDRWIGGLGHEEAAEIIQRLTKDSVRNAHNKRPGSENESHDESGGYASHSHGYGGASGYQQGQGQYGNRTDSSNRYGNNDSESYNQGSRYGLDNQYDSSGAQYGSDNQYSLSGNEYGSGNQYESSGNRYNSGNQYDSSNNEYGSSGNRYDSGNQYESSGSEYSSANQYSSSVNRYASGNQYSRNNEDEYGQTESRRSDNQYSSEYGAPTESRYGESGNSYGRSDNERYGYDSSRREEDEGGYGSRYSENENRGNRNNYGDSNYNRYGSNEGRTDYDGYQREDTYGSRRSDNEYSSGQRGSTSRYGEGSYEGSGYGGRDSDQTYGVERLRMDNDDDNDDDKYRHGHHRHHKSQDSD